jgi:hypothetical protein
MKLRNYTLARVAKCDPTRYRTRTVMTEKEKLRASRARRKSVSHDSRLEQ